MSTAHDSRVSGAAKRWIKIFTLTKPSMMEGWPGPGADPVQIGVARPEIRTWSLTSPQEHARARSCQVALITAAQPPSYQGCRWALFTGVTPGADGGTRAVTWPELQTFTRASSAAWQTRKPDEKGHTCRKYLCWVYSLNSMKNFGFKYGLYRFLDYILSLL